MRAIAEARADAARGVERSLAQWAWAAASDGVAERMPMRIPLRPPSESDAFDRLADVIAWSASWLIRSGPGDVETVTRRWRSHGTQTLPLRLILPSPAEAADFAGLGTEWRTAVSRTRELWRTWPHMRGPNPATMRRMIAVDELNWAAVLRFLEWAADRDLSELLPRQIPIPGVDSKWFERHRSLLAALRALGAGSGTLEVRDLDKRILVRVLDPRLRQKVGGFGDFDAAASELAQLDWQPSEVIICENAQCAFSFGDRQGTILLARQGYAVDVFGRIPWLRDARVRYWGDVDTHGFAILDRLRHYVPHASSVLMDSGTLLEHRALWATEVSGVKHPLPFLTDEERSTYEQLVEDVHGAQLRLEQERIPWAAVERAFS